MNVAPSPLDSFEPTRNAGLERLEAFVPFAGAHYAKHRNTDFIDRSAIGVSGLSPYLRYRLLTQGEVISAVLAQHSLEASQKFVQEVVWGTYWRGWLQMRPGVWDSYLAERDIAHEALDQNGSQQVDYQAAIAGNTGIDCFDDWVRVLVETGYLHNHVRMWFASIWIFTLKLPWTLGADFFMQHLLDGDPASNTLSWRWVAGIQTRGKTYLATPENIHRYTEGRYLPTGLATSASPIEAAEPPGPMELPKRPTPSQALTCPSVCVVHAFDLALASFYRAHPMCQKLVWLLPSTSNEPGLGRRGCEFVAAAMELERHPGEETIENLEIDALFECLERMDATQLVIAESPVGGCSIPMFQQEKNRSVTQVRRSYDDALWPLATKGFFPFKEKALGFPPLIKAIGDI